MRDDPDKEFIISFLSGSDIKENIGQFILGIPDMDAVEFQKHKHRMGTDPFVAVDESMIAGQTETES